MTSEASSTETVTTATSKRLLAVVIIVLSLGVLVTVTYLLLVRPANQHHTGVETLGQQQVAALKTGLKNKSNLLDLAAATETATTISDNYLVTSSLEKLTLKNFTLVLTGSDGYTWQYISSTSTTTVTCGIGCTFGVPKP